MEPMKPSVMITQVNDLPLMMRTQMQAFDRIIRNILSPLEFLSLHRIVVVGDGDSYHGALAAEMAFEAIGKIACEPLSAMRFLEYGAEYIPTRFPNDTLVIGISASGRTQRVVQALEKAHATSGFIRTVAFTGVDGSAVSKAAEKTVHLSIPDLGASPGIRTYSATLMGLILLAIRIGEIQNRFHMDAANAMRKELEAVADVVEASIPGMQKTAQEAARAFKDAPHMIFLGSGPSFGTAIFSAAKVIEATGIFSIGQDLEEWAHVERFAYPDDIPTFIIAPPGAGYWRAVDLAKSAKSLGRKIIAVVHKDDTEIAPLADFVFRVEGDVREEFSSLAYHIPADLFASSLAEIQGKFLFQSDRNLM
jgi:glutamine---fructose-6-phosphate transaminase (isomerizing)